LFKIEAIQEFLPHRYPFLLVDRVLELEGGKRIVALKNVSVNEAFFQGHFPKRKIMPGVLIIEAVAQAGGILLFHSIPDPLSKIVLLSKVDNARFRKPVVPGDQLRLEAEIIKLKTRFCFLRGRALVDGEIVVDGDITASLLDIEEMNDRK
jgi:3-hydroxyacyl-[acyl-carrier-protein] dehydratase